MSFKNRSMISGSYDFRAHQHCSRRRWFSQTALQWLEVLPALSLVLPGTPRLVVSAARLVISPPRLVIGAPKWSQASCPCSQVLPWLLPDLPCPPGFVASAPKCTWRPLHQSSTLRDLTTLVFWSDNFQTLPEAPRDKNPFCWCGSSESGFTGSSGSGFAGSKLVAVDMASLVAENLDYLCAGKKIWIWHRSHNSVMICLTALSCSLFTQTIWLRWE